MGIAFKFIIPLSRLDLNAGVVPGLTAVTSPTAVSGLQAVLWGNQTVQAIRVRISLAGPALVLWRGDYWYRRGGGRNLISRSDRGPGSRPIRIELTAER